MKAQRPPGPPNGLTGLGHIRHLKSDLIEYLEGIWREYGDAFRLWVAGVHVNFFAHPELTEAVLVDQSEAFGKPARMRKAFRHLIRDGSPLNDGPEWPARRRMVNHALASLDYERLVSATRRQAKRLILDRADDSTLDMADALERAMIAIAIDVSLGEAHEPVADHMYDDLIEGLQKTIDMANSPVPLWLPIRRQRRTREISQSFVELAEQSYRRCQTNGQSPHDCLIAAMDQLQRSSAVDQAATTPRLVQEEALMMIVGGKETAGPAAMWATQLLAAHPEFQATAVDELCHVVGDREPTAADVPKLKLLGAAYSEAIRLYPPAFIVLREARRATEVGGYRVTRGDMICIYTYGVHRDPRWFNEPLKYDPYRFIGEDVPSSTIYTPFGLGKRACPAARFATVSTVLLLANLLQRYRLEVPPESPPVEPVLFMGLRPKEGLHLRLVERNTKVGVRSEA